MTEFFHSGAEKQNAPVEAPQRCSQCGWPGTGTLPAGVGLMKQNGKTVLVGKLSYFRINTVLCSLCQELESAVATRPWFVNAHAEYLEQIKVKKQKLDHG
jgi:hypothetical protein